MKRSVGKAVLIAMALGLVSLTPLRAQEQMRAQRQTRVGFGPTAGYAIDATEPFLGGLLRIAPPMMLGENLPLMFDGGFEYYFDRDGATLGPSFTIQVAGVTEFTLANSQIKPTAGAGFSFTRFSADAVDSDTKINLQLQGGVMVNIVSLDGMLRIGGETDLILRAAVLFGSLMR